MTALFAGLLHPLIVPAHVLAIGALALLIGQQTWGRNDSPPEALALLQANLTLLGTALGAVLLLLALLQGTARLRHHWQRIGARILGSWIAAIAILVLALRLMR
jgi:urease accessory protein